MRKAIRIIILTFCLCSMFAFFTQTECKAKNKVTTYTYYKTTTDTKLRSLPDTGAGSDILVRIPKDSLVAVDIEYGKYSVNERTMVKASYNRWQGFVFLEDLTDETGVTLPETITRYFGQNRYETAIITADALKEAKNVEKFSSIIVASGESYPDALAGSYLSKVKEAPILLVNKSSKTRVAEYIYNNLEEGGMVYILGGENAVSEEFATLLTENEITYNRLGGSNRYETNLLILDEAGVTGGDYLVCSGTGFADSLSASAVGLPILLVGNKLTEAQETYLEDLEYGHMYLIGGEKAVTTNIETALGNKEFSIDRIYGANRYETSEKVALEFFYISDEIMLAYGQNFPDGLSGGPLALELGVPLVLADSTNIEYANIYAHEAGTMNVVVLGGTGLISDIAIRQIFR